VISESWLKEKKRYITLVTGPHQLTAST